EDDAPQPDPRFPAPVAPLPDRIRYRHGRRFPRRSAAAHDPTANQPDGHARPNHSNKAESRLHGSASEHQYVLPGGSCRRVRPWYDPRFDRRLCWYADSDLCQKPLAGIPDTPPGAELPVRTRKYDTSLANRSAALRCGAPLQARYQPGSLATTNWTYSCLGLLINESSSQTKSDLGPVSRLSRMRSGVSNLHASINDQGRGWNTQRP